MSKYKVGDKFIIEIIEKYTNDADDFVIEDEILYKVKGFKSLVFDSYGLDKLQKYEDTDYVEGVRAGLNSFDCEVKKAYYKGLNDAWELARKIENKMSLVDLKYLFNSTKIADILDNFTPQQALAKIEAYEESKKQLKRFEVVEAPSGNLYYVSYIEDNDNGTPIKYHYVGLDKGFTLTSLAKFKKTGKRLDIEHLLEQIRGNE